LKNEHLENFDEFHNVNAHINVGTNIMEFVKIVAKPHLAQGDIVISAHAVFPSISPVTLAINS